MVEDIGQRQDCGLVAAVPVEGCGEGRRRLVGQLPIPPQAAGLVDELLELRGVDQPIMAWSWTRPRITPVTS